jgi:alkanesulfonate monooxygenase SsuD/methylene tetrahydromethanopterin reductase-like flavin-dependent oxidoreductase (luciferase family)
MALRFGVTVIPSATGRSDPVEEARHAESLGFDLVSVWDHPFGETPSLETWTLLSWMAASTSRISFLPNVLGLPYRPPLVLAKMAETYSRLSSGRLILGLGAGSARYDWASLGLEQRSPRENVEALEEAIGVIQGAWSPGQAWVEGKHYSVRGPRMEPKPDRPIPIWLGVYGAKTIALCGRLADGWLPSLGYCPPERASRLMEQLHAAAREAGRSPDEITCAYNVGIRVGGGPPEDPSKQVAGEPDEVAAELASFVGLGFSVLNLWVSGDRSEQRERLATEVFPRVRELTSPA